MSRPRHAIALVVALAAVAGLLAVAAAATEKAAAPEKAAATSIDAFAILTERNIFLSTRTAPRRRSAAPAATKRTEDTWVVRGVFSRGEAYAALCENTATGATCVVGAGETVGAVQVAAVTLDGVDVGGGEATRRVAVGRTLLGGRAVAAKTAAGKSPVKTAGKVDAKSILERLRQRRRREMAESTKSPAAVAEGAVKIERKQ